MSSKRGENKWVAKISMGQQPNGKPFVKQFLGKTKLILKILVTSIDDSVVELEFENLSEWQIKDNQYDITDTSIIFDNDCIVWCDDTSSNIGEMKNGSYVIAKSMKWRII